MGSGVSKNSQDKSQQLEDSTKIGRIFLKTDKNSYQAGDQISGDIYIHILSPYPAKSLFLRLEGKEVINIDFEMPLTRTPYCNEKSIIDKEVCIHKWDSLLPGQYAIPFTLTLPNDLPPTFNQEGRTFAAHLTYKLQAFFKSDHPLKPQLKSERKLVIRKPVKNHNLGHSTEVTAPISAWCCRSKGINTLKVHFEKTSYRPGEVARIAMELRSTNSQLNISEVSVILNQRLKLGNTCNWVMFTIPKAAQIIRGIRVPSSVYANAFSVRIPSFKGDDNDLDQRKKCWPRGTTDDSYGFLGQVTKGRIISSELFLEVTITLEGNKKPGPKVELPIEVYYPEPKTQYIELPDNWRPVKFERVEAVLQTEKEANKAKKKKVGVQTEMVEGRAVEIQKNVMSVNRIGQIFPDTGRQLDV